jgi:hypothetical protein
MAELRTAPAPAPAPADEALNLASLPKQARAALEAFDLDGSAVPTDAPFGRVV